MLSSIQLLGITVTGDENISIEQHFTPQVKAIENILKHWSRLKPSLKGKITVIISLVLSLIVYPASNLNTPNLILESLQRLFYELLWDGKRPKIAAKTILPASTDNFFVSSVRHHIFGIIQSLYILPVK